MRKWIIIGVVLLVAAFLIIPRLMAQGRQNTTASAQTGTVETENITTTIDTSGTVAPERSIYLTFGTGGEVKQVNVQIGDQVSAGQVIIALDTADLEYDIAVAQQALIQQQATYNSLIATPSPKDLTQAEASVASAKSQLATAKVNAETNNSNVSTTCADVDTQKLALNNAQTAYDNYVNDGYSADAIFVPDPDSQVGVDLRNAQTAYDSAVSKCDTAKLNADNSASVASAEASLAQAEASLAALQEGATKEDIDSAQAALAQKQLQLDNAKSKLANATVVAPFAGIVSDISVIVGQSVSANATAVTLLDTSALYVDATVDELYITQVKIGQDATFKLNNDASKALKGKVSRISPSGQLTSNVVTYSVRLQITPDSTATVLPGMTADVTITTGTINNALLVPTQAVLHDTQGDYVLVVGTGGVPQRVAVTAGAFVGSRTVVQGSLSAGQQIYLSDPNATTTSSSGIGGFGAAGGGAGAGAGAGGGFAPPGN
ncbi:MAG: efflux RND transporter periplasmic adaptor subunit [Anaerolineae bacterium]|nr:efflux RND transporter periplasmic adaptor subunit [Anaerolineae bacterium]